MLQTVQVAPIVPTTNVTYLDSEIDRAECVVCFLSHSRIMRPEQITRSAIVLVVDIYLGQILRLGSHQNHNCQGDIPVFSQAGATR